MLPRQDAAQSFVQMWVCRLHGAAEPGTTFPALGVRCEGTCECSGCEMVCPVTTLGHCGMFPRAFAAEGTSWDQLFLQPYLSTQSSQDSTSQLPPGLGLRELGRKHLALVGRVHGAQNWASEAPQMESQVCPNSPPQDCRRHMTTLLLLPHPQLQPGPRGQSQS